MTLGVLPDLEPVTLLMQASSDLLVPLLGISAGKWQVCDVPHMRVRLAIACGLQKRLPARSFRFCRWLPGMAPPKSAVQL